MDILNKEKDKAETLDLLPSLVDAITRVPTEKKHKIELRLDIAGIFCLYARQAKNPYRMARPF